MELNINAKTYVSEAIEKENAFFDQLEKEFEENNKWLFEVVEVPINPPNTPVPGKSYSEIVKTENKK